MHLWYYELPDSNSIFNKNEILFDSSDIVHYSYIGDEIVLNWFILYALAHNSE